MKLNNFFSNEKNRNSRLNENMILSGEFIGTRNSLKEVVENYFIKNKKAQVHFGLLVVIAIILSLAALYAMASFNESFEEKSREFSDVISEIEMNEKFVISLTKEIVKEVILSCRDCSENQIKEKFKELVNERDLRIEELGNFFGKIRNDEFSLTKENEEYKLEVNSLFVKSKKGYNEITRNFDICLLFDKEGNFVRNC